MKIQLSFILLFLAFHFSCSLLENKKIDVAKPEFEVEQEVKVKQVSFDPPELSTDDALPPSALFPKTFGQLVDDRDGQIYKTARLKDNRIWMVQNLNYQTKNSYCYNDTLSYCESYGRLYTWHAANKACPKGWRLPSTDEWSFLLSEYGGEGYYAYNDLTSNEFSAQKGGCRDADKIDNLSGGTYETYFLGVSVMGGYWSGTLYDPGPFILNAAYVESKSRFVKANYKLFPKENAYSCRCIKNQ